jgi:hypothetical protein
MEYFGFSSAVIWSNALPKSTIGGDGLGSQKLMEMLSAGVSISIIRIPAI